MRLSRARECPQARPVDNGILKRYAMLMGNLTRAKIIELYDQFKSESLTFTKEAITATGLLTNMVSLKCATEFFPCVIYSSSFEMAKVVANNKSGVLEKYQKANNTMHIRFHFSLRETGEQVVFLVPVRLSSTAPYSGSQDMSILNLQFTQRPPDDLIEILGRVEEALFLAQSQSEKLFPMQPDTFRKMRFLNKEIAVSVGGTNFGSVLRELGFGQARFIFKDAPKTVLEKPASINFNFDEPRESYTIEGTVSRYEVVAEHKALSTVTISFNPPVSLVYKLRMSDYVSTLRMAQQRVAKAEAEPAADAASAANAGGETTADKSADANT